MSWERPAALRVTLPDLMADALANLAVQPQRTSLALLGVMIGTACVIAMVSIGHMAELEAVKIFSASGVNVLVVQAGTADPRTGAPTPISLEAVSALPKRNPDILAVAPLATGTEPVSAGGEAGHVDVAAAGPELQSLSGLAIISGRPLEPVDADSLVALIGANLAEKLSVPGSVVGVGSKLRVGRYVFNIVGVLAPRSATAFDPSDFGGGVVVPMGSARRVLDNPGIDAAVLRMRPEVDAQAVSAWIIRALQPANSTSPIQVQSARGLIATLKAQKAVQAHLLAAIGAVSLVVGGIGVMNVMFMSVMERRREIGLRAAIGATPRDIQLMFLVEAIVLTVAGGLAGSLVGVAVAFVVARLSHWTFSLAFYALPLGVGVAVLVGIVFGLYPAIKASRLSPIEALRGD